MRKLSLGLGIVVVMLGLFTLMGATAAHLAARLGAAIPAAPVAVVSAAGGTPGIYISIIKGQKQGVIKGDVTSPNARKDWIKLDSLQYELNSPRDAATGQATGKRQHKPVTVITKVSKQSPKLFTATTTNERLDEVVIKFFKASATGAAAGTETNYYTIKLTNATISGYRTYSDGTDQLEAVSFTFEKITLTYEDGAITAQDDWQAAAN